MTLKELEKLELVISVAKREHEFFGDKLPRFWEICCIEDMERYARRWRTKREQEQENRKIKKMEAEPPNVIQMKKHEN